MIIPTVLKVQRSALLVAGGEGVLKYFYKIRLNFISWEEYIMKRKNLEKAIILGLMAASISVPVWAASI